MKRNQIDKIKTGFLKRTISTGRVAFSALNLAGRGLRGSRGQEAEKRIGDVISKELDQLKGMAMKVGQILSYMDGALPETVQESLRSLQAGTKYVKWDTMKGVLESAFKRPVSDLYESFEMMPIAAASIGQVYRAKFNGDSVAVKIQYPDVAKLVSGDFSKLRSFAKLASLGTAADASAIVAELEKHVQDECKYLVEAKNQERFRKLFQENHNIVVPRVISERTKDAVLTTRWYEGVDFYQFCKLGDLELRKKVASNILEFSFRSFFEFGLINADPHPGNYLFNLNSEKVVFLDFGCVKEFDQEFVAQQKDLLKVVLDDNRSGFKDVFLNTGMVSSEEKFDFEIQWQMIRHQFKPFYELGFRFTKSYFEEWKVFSSPSNKNLRLLSIPPSWIWFQRLLWGLNGILYRLDAKDEYSMLMKKFL